MQVVRDDYFGNRSILSTAGPGQLFAEGFACAGVEALPVSVVATADSNVMLIDCSHIMTMCKNACPFHNQMIRNLLHSVAKSNLQLNQKIEILSKRTTREKVMAYLLSEAKIQGRDDFSIPYDRQELADYLGVERSAMSAVTSTCVLNTSICSFCAGFSTCTTMLSASLSRTKALRLIRRG